MATADRCQEEEKGQHEVEIFSEGEVGQPRTWDLCTKNPEHKEFIPVDQFVIDNIPSPYNTTESMEYIQTMIKLTVRTTTIGVSERRPRYYPGTKKPYPLSRENKSVTRTGTGWVYWVLKRTNNICPCKKCFLSLEPKTEFAFIYVQTATHVVFDEIEAERTTCHLFFDREDTPRDCPGVVQLEGMFNVKRRIRKDIIKMECVTHDLDLAVMLDGWVKNCQKLLNTKKVVQPEPKDDSVVVIVSHPHGCSKKVTVGKWVEKDTEEEGSVYRYKTATCAGSSGARVLLLGSDYWWWWGHTHSGYSEFNYSGCGRELKSEDDPIKFRFGWS